MVISELLSDGEWHDLIEVLHAGMKVVPPGEATRRTERERTSSYTSRGVPAPDRDRPTSLDRQVLTGQRALARDQMAYMYQTGKIEMDHYPSREDWHTPGAVKVHGLVEMPTVPRKRRSCA